MSGPKFGDYHQYPEHRDMEKAWKELCGNSSNDEWPMGINNIPNDQSWPEEDLLDISLAIMTFSGFERPNTPAVANVRVHRLLKSIRESNFPPNVKISVFDDGSEASLAQDSVRQVCEEWGADYSLAPFWVGVSGNYNRACGMLYTKWVALISDDQIVSPYFFSPMHYFLLHNSHVNLGMVGWSVIFADDLVVNKVLAKKDDFYRKTDWLSYPFKDEIYGSKWGCNGVPRPRGHSSGSAFVLRRELWEQMGGFYEKIFQPDEDFGDWVWNSANAVCVQLPTPPVFHYGGGSSFGDHCEDDCYKHCHDNWVKRPHGVGETFEERGRKANGVINEMGELHFNHLRAKFWDSYDYP